MAKYDVINAALKNNRCRLDFNELSQLNNKNQYQTRQILLNYLYIEISKLEKNVTPKKCKYIYKGFKYLDNIDSVKEKKQVLDGLNKIKNLCESKIKENVNDENIVFNKILDIIEISLLNMSLEINCNDKKAELLKYVVYELKNINYVYELIKTYPSYIFIKDDKGFVLESIIDDYVVLAKSGTYSFDLIYLEKIIKIFVEHKFFDQNIELKKQILNKTKAIMKDNRKSTFFLNQIIDDITKSSILKKNIEDFAYKYNININEFNDENISNIIINEEKTINLKDIYTITIDGVNTVVYDDAVSLIKINENQKILVVFVADVASYVPKNSIIDKMAYDKSETLYLPQQTIKMLPDSLTKNLTLKEKNDRTALGHFFLIENNEIVDFKVEKCLINVDKNYSYDEVIKQLNYSENTKELEFLTELANIGVMLHKNSGNRHEYRELKKLKKEVNGIETYDTSISTIMIMEFMTLTNNYIAKYFANHPEIPFIFRANTQYSKDVFEKLNKLSVEDLNALNRYLQAFSFYTPLNLGHKGLSIDAYCHSTNPLRNYASLETQRIIIDSIINGYLPDDYEQKYKEIQDLCTYMNNRLETNKAFKEEYKIYKYNSHNNKKRK